MKITDLNFPNMEKKLDENQKIITKYLERITESLKKAKP